MWGEDVRSSQSGLAYHRAGDGPPVVLLHGVPGSAASWAAVAERLPADIDVIVPDLLGFGASARPQSLAALHAAAQAAALAALLTELGAGPAVVVGHDFGGPVALLLTAAHPAAVSAIALFATNTFTDTPIPFPLSLVNWPIVGPPARKVLFSRLALRMMLRQGVGPGGRVPDPSTHIGDGDQRAAIATIFAGSLIDLDALYAPVEAQVHALRIPTFVGWGDRDPFFPLAQGQRTAGAAGAELRCYGGAGHFLPQERPAELAADIAALLAAVPS